MAAIACLIHIAVALFLTAIALDWLSPPVPLIFTAVAFIGIGRALLRLSYQALFGQIIPRDQLPRYTTYASSAFQICVVAGPRLGRIHDRLSRPRVDLPTRCLMWRSGFGITFITAVQEKSSGLPNYFLKSFLEGFHYVKKHELILGIMALDMFAVLFGWCSSYSSSLC
ncbi:hypothetical protein [Polynucleobacter necessarius]|uniref:hypothetical protein n=1 Tax=Polynucleobacter necessarius TaxID=576610 RepID=UPI0039E6ECD1